jgi:signal peptidase I
MNSKVELALIFIALLIISKKIFKYRRCNIFNKNTILGTMALIGVIQVSIHYVIGLLTDFSKNALPISEHIILVIVIPLTIIIIIQEFLRYQFAINKGNTKVFKLLTIILFIIVDVTIFGSTVNLRSLDSTVTFLGTVLFPSIVNNVVYNRMTVKYGYKTIIVYRIITIISYYFIPVIPNMNLLVKSVFKITLPLIIYLTMSYMFDRVEFEAVMRKRKGISISTIILLIIILLATALVSCAFRYGIMAIGSGSMTGTINYGDAVIFEKYKDQELEIGDIIIYAKKDKNVIHRITEIGVFNDEYVYVTKGDNNKYADSGYVYKENIVGIIHKRIKYIGFPAIWFRSLFNN